MARLGSVAVGVLLAALAVTGAAALSAGANPPLACYKAQKDEFGVTGNYKNATCTEKTAILKGEYVLAEPLLFLKGELWCAKLNPVVGPPGTGLYENSTCTKKQENGEYTEVIEPPAPPVTCYKAENDEFGVSGNYKNATCTEKTAVLKGEYVLAEPLLLLKENVWCAKMNPIVGPPGTGRFENATCTKKQENGEYTEVIVPSGGEATKILPEPTVAKPVSFTAKSSATITLEQVNGKTVKCKKGAGSDTFTTPNLGTGSVLFEECTSSEETVCTGVGDAKGTVEQKGEVHFVLALEMESLTKAKLVTAFAFLVKQFHFTCTNTELGVELLVLTRGCVAAVQDGGENLLSAITVLFEKFAKGETKILSILMEGNTKEEIKCLLESTITEEKSGEKFELASVVGSVLFEKWKQGGVEEQVLLMN